MARFEVGIAFMVLLASMAVTTCVTKATITCGEVTALLIPCIPFGVLGGIVPPGCCAGIKGLNAAQNTTEDRRIACTCIQEGAAGIPGIDYDRINMLGDLCGSACPYKVYPSTNCSQVS
ncbi:non-specific lipid-transfer protein 1-like [Argentina anserina]|uniref:non-specific lipid-transfer protein 1-like n=1 Tax=Argentina anserina TaxID=57926 RepID=UPI0021764D1E|nr:non-specific lipid-transfer protein 1-like [Potentilla anserina]